VQSPTPRAINATRVPSAIVPGERASEMQIDRTDTPAPPVDAICATTGAPAEGTSAPPAAGTSGPPAEGTSAPPAEGTSDPTGGATDDAPRNEDTRSSIQRSITSGASDEATRSTGPP